MILKLGFYLFCRLKMHRKPLVYSAQCRVPDWTPQNKSGPSKVTPPAEDTWSCAKNRPKKSIVRILLGIKCKLSVFIFFITS